MILARKSWFYLIKTVALKSAEDVTTAIIDLLIPYKKDDHTIMADNSREFIHHER
ncbi:hypothetical protein [Candidatus Enterovibrio escicola]|uniref:Mobile element protein n=1 Tax=Candidatus Enterovibrio escicola TaxID=1927127 RepID=A0A2A5T659_9GAMM|nr:Mobile element protein [Candidatus Enterovibrio escacola]